jgi:cold shock protein
MHSNGSTEGSGFIQPEDGSADVSDRISAVGRAEMRSFIVGQEINYEITRDTKSGKMSADQLSGA